MRRLLAIAAAFVLVIAACSGEDTTDATEPDMTSSTSSTTSTPSTTTTLAPTTTSSAPATTTTSSPSAGLDASCTSPNGFSVSYPDDWETNAGDVVSECTLFDPDTFTVPEGTDERVAAIRLDLESVPYSTLADLDDSDGVDAKSEMTIDGRAAVRVEHAVGNDGLYPEGTSITSYYIDLESEQQSLVANTVDLSAIDYGEAKNVLDRMVDTLDLDVPATSSVRPVGEFSSTPVASSNYPASGEPSWLTDVRFGVHDGFDRVVFEFEDAGTFSYSIEYVEEAVPASGTPIDVTGEATLAVTMQPASGVDASGDEPRETYTGSERLAVSGADVTELVQIEDFESVLTWALGIESRSDVAVDTLEDPHRLVVDIATG